MSSVESPRAGSLDVASAHGSRRRRRALASRPPKSADAAPVCVAVGDINLVRALGHAGIPCVSITPPPDPSRLSRHVCGSAEWIDPECDEECFVAAVAALADELPAAPVVMPQTDAALLALSRNRKRFAGRARLSLASADLVEDVVDKARFQVLAELLGLPVPPALILRAGATPTSRPRFPAVAKPLTRMREWDDVEPVSKAWHVLDEMELARVRELDATLDLLVQDAVPGPETRIESYHLYAQHPGDVVAHFTGRKVRTYPVRYGYSTAVEITDSPDVLSAGLRAVERLGLTGVAKLDFKRGPDGRLHLLEVNPRHSLWHFPGAVAGVNLPALLYADLTGTPRPRVQKVRAGVTWCQPLEDLRAVRAEGGSLVRWLLWLARCDAPSSISLTDPRPFVQGRALPTLRVGLGRG